MHRRRFLGMALLCCGVTAYGFDSRVVSPKGRGQSLPKPRLSPFEGSRRRPFPDDVQTYPAPPQDAPIDPQDLIDELANLRAMRKELLRDYTHRHPDVRFIEQEIQRLRAELSRIGPDLEWLPMDESGR